MFTLGSALRNLAAQLTLIGKRWPSINKAYIFQGLSIPSHEQICMPLTFNVQGMGPPRSA